MKIWCEICDKEFDEVVVKASGTIDTNGDYRFTDYWTHCPDCDEILTTDTSIPHRFPQHPDKRGYE